MSEIVKCKDCKHYNFETHGCKRSPSVERWWKNDYCSYGEKQVTGKLKNADDSLLTEDTNMDKEQRSKLESAEAVHGEWIEVEVFPEVYDIEGVKTWGSEMQCDQCGFRHTAIEGHMAQYNYCPNCGAKMKGGAE